MSSGRTALAIDPATAPLTPEDHRLLALVEPSLERGRALLRWWTESTPWWPGVLDPARVDAGLAHGGSRRMFRLVEFSRRLAGTDANYGFFDRVAFDRVAPDRVAPDRVAFGARGAPVLGSVQQLFFDQPWLDPLGRVEDRSWEEDPAALLARWRAAVNAFVIGPMLRTSSWSIVRSDRPDRPLDDYLRLLSWYPDPRKLRVGAGFEQIYYRRPDGLVGKFWEPDRAVRLEELVAPGGADRLVVDIRNSGSFLSLDPGGGLRFHLPVRQRFLGVVAPDMVWQIDPLETDGRGSRVGMCFALLGSGSVARTWNDPPALGFLLNDFFVEADGRILSRVVFVRDRPKGVFEISLDPFEWVLNAAEKVPLIEAVAPWTVPLRRWTDAVPIGRVDPLVTYAGLANVLTGGRAAKDLGISRAQLFRQILQETVLRQRILESRILLVWRDLVGRSEPR